MSPLGDVQLTEDEYGMVMHTNHFLENKFTEEHPWLPGSPIRLDRVRELARGLVKEGVTEDAITPAILRERIFSDNYNDPQSICAQEDLTRHPTVRSASLFNIVMNLDPRNPSAEIVMDRSDHGMEGPVMQMPWV